MIDDTKIFSENKSEYIYLLQEREFIKTNEPMTSCTKTRMTSDAIKVSHLTFESHALRTGGCH